MPRLHLSLPWLLWTICISTLLTVVCAFWFQYSLLREVEREMRRTYGIHGILSGLSVNIKANLVQADSQLERYIDAPSRSNRDAGYTLLDRARTELNSYASLQQALSGKTSRDLYALRTELEDNISELLQLVLQTHEASERVHEARQKLLDFMLYFSLPSGLYVPRSVSFDATWSAQYADLENGLNRVRSAVVMSVVSRSPDPLHELDTLLTRLAILAAELYAVIADPDLKNAQDTADNRIKGENSTPPSMTGQNVAASLLHMRRLSLSLFGEWDRLSLVRAEANILGQRNIIAASRIVENTLLLGNQSRIELEKQFDHIATLLLFLGAAAALLCISGFFLLWRRLCKPISRITNYVRAATDKQQAVPLPVEVTPELDALATLVERLASILYTRLHIAEKDKHTAIEACISARNELAARNAFLNYVGHEIRTPANSILGLLYLCHKSALDPATEDYLSKIQLAAETQLAVLTNMLDFARIESDNLALENAPFSLSRVLGDLRDLIAPLMSSKNLSFAVTIAPNVPDTLRGDAMRLRQILHNLSSNAIKFTERGNVTVAVSMADAPFPDSSADGTAVPTPGSNEICLHFCVQDTGIGIPPDMLHRLFEPFQAGGGESSSYARNGLGLSIAYRLAQMMRGRIWVRSQPHEGSEFHFTIICEQAGTALSEKPVVPFVPRSIPAQLHAAPPDLRGFHVLLVEDDAISSQIATELLESCGLRVTTVQTGIEAVEATHAHSYDLIMMDIQMPVMDGLEATRRIRAQQAQSAQSAQQAHSTLPTQASPIIAMTAHTLDEDRQRCFEAGMQGYIAKPIQVHALHTLLSHHLQHVSAAPATTPAALPMENTMSVLDIALGLHHLNGNEKLYDKLLRRFADSNATVPQDIRTAADAGDMETAIRVAHTVKGVAASLGASRLHEQALVVEQALKNGTLEQDALDTLQDEVQLAITAINTRLG